MGGIYGADTVTLPLPWLTWLATSELRLAVYSVRELYGVARFLHLVGMAAFLGLVVLLDLRGLGVFPQGSLDPVRGRLGLVLRVAFWLTIASGVLLFLRDPLGAGLHSMFLPKLLLVALGYGHATAARRFRVLRATPRRRQAGAVLSLGVWLLVVGASTWNHVERPARIGDALRLHNLGR